MSPHIAHKGFINNRIAIVMESIAGEPFGLHEHNRSNEINDETLHENVVEKYLQSILKPMNMMQALFVCARYKMRDNIITPNNRRYNFLSVCASVILMAIIYIMFFMSANRTGLEIFNYFFVNIYDFILYFIGGFLNACTNIEQRLNNVLFVLKIQNVHRILKLNGRSFNNFTISNWICVVTINCFHFSWMCMYFYIFYEIGIANILTSYTCIRFDMNMIYATRSMKLVYKGLKSWIVELRMSGYTDDIQDEQYWDSMFKSYIDIIEVFQIVEKTLNRQVLFYIVHTSSNTLLDIWIRIEMKTPDYEDVQYALLTCMSLTWVLKNLILLSSLSMECEGFYSAMTEAQSTSIQIVTSRGCSETRKRFCKNIQRVQSATFKKMNVCGLFTIDAVMLVQVIGLITTYTIVLLQFEFL